MDLVVLGILVPTFYSSELFDEDPAIVSLVAGMAFFFILMPHILLRVLQKPTWTELDSISRSIRLLDANKTVRTISWESLQSLSYSEYSYTVKTKNGSRTITVFTVLGHLDGETIKLAESTNFSELRLIGETIAKFLKLAMRNESGELVPYHDLDLPLHKRMIPNGILESDVSFNPNSQLSIEKREKDSVLISNYKPKIYTIVAFSVSIALTLMIHFFFGSAFEISVTSWETFPPDIYQLVFLIISIVLGFLPLSYVWWNGKRKKEIRISKDAIYLNEKVYPFDDWEEILLKNNSLYIVNDHTSKTYPLHFFCETGDMNQVRIWVQKEIWKQSGGNEELGRF